MPETMTTLMPEITHGHHCCLLFSTAEDQLAHTVPFLGIGLERGERCVWVGDPASVERIRHGLKGAGVSVEEESRKNRLILSSDRDYLEAGRFNTDKMLSFLQQAYDAAMAGGFTALRAAGDVAWEVGPERNFRDIVYYETLLDVFFLGKKMVGMCQYPRQSVPPEVLAGILNTHRIAAIDAHLCSNFHYVPPDFLLEKDEGIRHAKRVEWMTSQLLRARKAEEEIMRLNAELEQRVVNRTRELQQAYQDMEAFSYSVSHDLRAPLRAVDGFAKALAEDSSTRLDAAGKDQLDRILKNTDRMSELIEDLLRFSRTSRTTMVREPVDMTALARTAATETGATGAAIAELPPAEGDASLLRQVWTNLLANAVKFTRKTAEPRVRVGFRTENGLTVYYVRDNGAGFDPAQAGKLFGVFSRLHRPEEYEGTGIGLAIVQRIVQRHGGRIWAEGAPGQGAEFAFTLAGPKT